MSITFRIGLYCLLIRLSLHLTLIFQFYFLTVKPNVFTQRPCNIYSNIAKVLRKKWNGWLRWTCGGTRSQTSVLSVFPGAVLADLRDCEEMATFWRVRVLADCVVLPSPSFGLSDTHTSLSTSIPAYTHTSLLSMSKSILNKKPSVLFATSTMSSNSWTTPKTTHAYRLVTTFARQRFSQSSTTHSISIQRWSSSYEACLFSRGF